MLNHLHKQKMKEKYGVNEDFIEEFEQKGIIKSLKRDEVNEALGRNDVPCGGMMILYPNEKEIFTIRLDEPFAPDTTQKPRRYLKPAGQTNHGYCLSSNDIGHSQLWVIEGEMKALCLASKGLSAIGLSGIYGWRCDNKSEKANLSKMLGSNKTSDIDDSEALVEELKTDFSGKIVTLIYDSDINQEHPVWFAYQRLAEEFYARGAEQVKIFITPALNDLDKTGIDDIFASGLKNNLSDDVIIEGLKEQMDQVPAYLPRKKGAQRIIDQITLKGENATRDEKVCATAIVLNRDGLAKATEFSQQYEKLKKSILNEAKMIKKTQKNWYQKKFKTDDLDQLFKIIKQMIEINAEEKKPVDIFNNDLFEKTYKVFKACGNFYRSQTGEVYYHYLNEIIDMISARFSIFFTNKTTLTIKSGSKGKYLLERLISKVSEDGETVTLFKGSYYSVQKKICILMLETGK